MLKCPRCGTDNLMTAVFCRGCGEKIPLDEIKPDDFEDVGVKKNNNTMQNIIGGAIIGVLLVVFLIGVLFPSCGKVAYSEETGNAAVAKIEKIGKGESITLTDEEASCYATARLRAYADGKDDLGSPKPTAATIHFLGDESARVIVSGRLYAMPVSVSGMVSVKASNKSIDLTLDGSPKIGLFPIPEGLREQLFDNLRSVFSEALRKDNQRVKALKVEEGKITITRTGKKQ